MNNTREALAALRLLVEYQTAATSALIQVRHELGSAASDPSAMIRLAKIEDTQNLVARCLDALKRPDALDK